MTVIRQKSEVKHYMVSFRRGEYVLEGIKNLIEQEKIDAGLIVSGIGSMDVCKIHYIETTALPPSDRYVTLNGPIEIGGFQGSIAGGEPHIHIVVFDQSNGTTHVGHLEPGSRCCYRVELGILAFSDVETKRETDPETGLIDIVEDGA